jgi:hypothetical protein
MRISIKGKTYGLCKSCQICEFYNPYSLRCELPFGEIHYFNSELVRPIKQDDIFKL